MPTAVETFEGIIQQHTTAELVPFLLTLTKQERQALRRPTLVRQKAWAAAWAAANWNNTPPGWRESMVRQQAMLALAGLAVYSRTEALAGSFELPYGLGRTAINTPLYRLYWQVLRHFRPAWLSNYFVLLADRGATWSLPSYPELRRMEQAGLVGHHGPTFAWALAFYLSDFNEDAERRTRLLLPELEALILADLLVDPALLGRDIWLLFDHETRLHNASAYVGQYIGGPAINWLGLLPKLVATGHLDRTKVLARCLLALRHNFERPLLVWFKTLYGTLSATPAERLDLQNELVELLPHAEPKVATLAVTQLTELLPEPTFSPALLLPYADGLFLRAELKTSLRALVAGLLKRLKQEPAQAPTVARLLALALPHPDAAVQERASKGLAGLLAAARPLLGPTEIAAALAAIEGAEELLSGPARAALAAWLGPPAPAFVPTPGAPYQPTTAVFVPDLSAATAITPVADWPELLFLTAQVAQHRDPAATERWLDGLLRLRGREPADFALQLRPYLLPLLPLVSSFKNPSVAQSIVLLAGSVSPDGPLPVGGHQGLTQALLLSWATGFTTPRVASVDIQDEEYAAPGPLLALEKQRYLWAEMLLRQGSALPLLSTPTHQPYWVAPSVLVARLLVYQAAGVPPNLADLALALARTAHGHATTAAEALVQLPALTGTGLRELLTWFLGPATADLPALPPAGQRVPAGLPAPLAEALPELWAVAARTKAPLGHFPALPAALGYDYPSVARPRLSTLTVVPFELIASYTIGNEPPHIYSRLDLTWDGGAAAGSAPSPLLLYVPPVGRSEDESWADNRFTAADLPFFLSLLPRHPAPVHEQALLEQVWANRLQLTGRAMLRQGLLSLLADGPAYVGGGLRLLASGLLHDAAECRGLAQEVLVRAISAGRLLPALLGRTMGQYLATGLGSVQGLADNLLPLTGTEATTDDALTQVLETLLPELPAAPPRNTRKLLELYATLQPRTARPVPAALQTRLMEWRTVGSLAKAVICVLS